MNASDKAAADRLADTVQAMSDSNARADAEARREADSRIKAGDKGPPSWAKIEEMAKNAGLRLVGPIRPGKQIASAGLDAADMRRIASCQSHDWDGNHPDRQDRVLRAQLGAALWAIGGGQ